jgi:hypothetical protein
MPVTADTRAAATSTLVENLAALWAVDPVLAQQIDAIGDADTLPLEPTRSGDFTAAIPVAGARPIYLHSRYNPVEESNRLADRVGKDDRHELFILGLGLGYHVAALRQRHAETTLWVFEPDLRTIRAAFEAVDLSTAILEKRIRLVTLLDKARLFADWMPHLAAMSVGHEIVDHAPSLQLHPEFFAAARGLIEEFLAFGKTTVNTLLINSRKTCENLAQNIPWYVAAPGIGRLKDAMKGKPAIIVAAGPSLRKNKHLLPQAVGKAVIISVQTTFQQMIDIGVEPDFVTSLDYHDICTQFFRHIPRTVRTELVAEPKATPKIFELNPGPLSLLGNDFIERLLREMKLNRPKVQAGATVAHLAFYLAEHLGCDPIIFVGQDLGFSEGLAYSPGTSYDEMWRPELGRFNSGEMLQWQRIVRDRGILRRVPDYKGRPTYTEERLFTYLQQFERDFLNSKRTIIDATEGGVAKRGVIPMTLADALAAHCNAPLDAAIPPHAGPAWDRLDEASTCLQKRFDEALRIERISRDTLPLLREIREALPDQSRVNRLIARIDPLRNEMNELGHTYDQITQLAQQSELNRFAADRRIAAAGVDGVERQRRQIDRDIANVEHMVGASADFMRLMTTCIGLIEQAGEQQRRAA